MIIKVDPDVREARHLKIWYNAGGRVSTNQIITSRPVAEGSTKQFICQSYERIIISSFVASWKTIGQIEKEKLGRQVRPDYVSVKAICMHIANDRVVYMVCYFLLKLQTPNIFSRVVRTRIVVGKSTSCHQVSSIVKSVTRTSKIANGLTCFA